MCNVKKGIDSDVNIFPFFEMYPCNVVGYVVHIGCHTNVVARHAFRKTGGPPGIEDVREIIPRIQFDLRFNWCVL
jgi:hypothetical protein